jgi:effector-binding domain-containing protein
MLRMCKALAVWAAAAAIILPVTFDASAQNPPGPAQPEPSPSQSPPVPAQPEPLPSDVFGQEVMMPAKDIVYMKGTATWDNAFETLVDAFKTVRSFLDRENIKPQGPAMTIYLSTDDTGFQFEAALPIAEQPKNPPHGDLALGKSPEGKALKFVHRGSYDAMDTTYDAITNFLDQKGLDAKDLFIEEYETDPTTTPEDKLVIDVFVPIQ